MRKEDHSKHSSTILLSGKTDDFSSAMASSSFGGGNRNPLLCVWLFLLLAWTCVGIEARTLSESKRGTTQAELGATDYPDYQTGVRYDEYPVVVPKRTALLLDKIMVALQKAVDEDSSVAAIPPNMPDSTMDLQRRGQQKGRVYWRCYFNAVTCFKRK